MTLVHVREKDIQTTTLTAATAFTQESGAVIHLEDGTTELELDGTLNSWVIKIIHALPKTPIIHVPAPDIFNTDVIFGATLVDENNYILVDENGYELFAPMTQSAPTHLLHAGDTG